jgi:hypothetical protein
VWGEMAAPGGTLVSLLFVVQLENVIKTTLVGHVLPGNVAHRLRHIQKKPNTKNEHIPSSGFGGDTSNYARTLHK